MPCWIPLVPLGMLLALAGFTGWKILGCAGGTEGEFEILLVLGTHVRGTEPTSMLSDRIDAAADYLKDHPGVLCVVSGYLGHRSQITEAECLYRELVKKGIEADRILRETQAASTMDNLELSLALLEQATGRRPEKLGILSSEYHLLRARMCAEQQGVQAVLLPAKTRHKPTFLLYFFREILAVWYYTTINQGRKHYD